jgi:glutathione-regulated potassium-efflux system ancillary protein KefF
MTDPTYGSPNTATVLVLVAHPSLETSRVNRRLMDAATAASRSAASGAGTVAVRDLYALYPDYLIDVQAEQAALVAARLVVLLHPIHWYGMTPLMKLWCDEVLSFGWAYGAGGSALVGKDLWLVASTGGLEASYQPQGHNRYPFDAFLPPYEQTATLCGMRFLPPMMIHGAHKRSVDEMNADATVFADRLTTWPQWPELEDLPACAACVVPAEERPVPGAAQALARALENAG